MADISYTPTTWADGAEGGTPIDAAKLNNIESGIVDAVAAIGPNDTTEDGTLKAQIDALASSVSYPSLTASKWVYITKPSGQPPTVFLPCPKAPNSVSVTNAEFFNGTWASLTFASSDWIGNYLVLRFAEAQGLANMGIYTARMNLTVS